MEPLSPGQRYARYQAYELAFELVDHATELVTNEAIFTDEEAETNRRLMTEAHNTLRRRMAVFAPGEVE